MSTVQATFSSNILRPKVLQFSSHLGHCAFKDCHPDIKMSDCTERRESSPTSCSVADVTQQMQGDSSHHTLVAISFLSVPPPIAPKIDKLAAKLHVATLVFMCRCCTWLPMPLASLIASRAVMELASAIGVLQEVEAGTNPRAAT